MGYRIALIGAGIISQSHLDALRGMEAFEPVAIADIQEERVKEQAAKYGLRPYTDYREMVRAEKPDAVAVSLPHFLHKEAAIWCLEEGCHVLLEKPMALNREECDAILEAEERTGRRLLVGHTQHFIPENRKAKELIESGTLGELVMVQDIRHVRYFTEQRPAWFLEKAKSGGGILMNLGSHSVDKLQWLTGARVTSVKAHVTHHGSRGDVEGSALAYLQTDRGFAATISLSGYEGVPINETHLLFTKGMIKLQTRGGLWISEEGRFREVGWETGKAPFVLQYEAFLRLMETGDAGDCSGAYARSIVSIIETAYASAEAGEELPVPEQPMRSSC
ncbi:hypothetical protein J31TS4_24260 [Paenibacillus sp. J31TS4]|uniref:Gfo/Idh/MocA family protein n=1 Tax=Paenibacillus sp. J31TS4 TaxID=2807195 RepID=UPI001B0DD9C2|nr:Gfo/Idh/MocA family oxidoreductase [Paenibacillus sp. J31TS4]GIP39146.1 hypothetical protein J31TS4_24260 [Paenibacillus sp. J31TS4]